MDMTIKRIGETSRLRMTRLASAMLPILAAGLGGAAHAVQVDVGHEDLNLRLDGSVRYTLGARAEKTNPDYASRASTDETESRFRRGEIFTNRLDLLTDIDLTYRSRHGLRLSAAGWADRAYDNSSTSSIAGGGNYRNNELNPYAKRYIKGPSGEFLDAFLFTGFDIGEVGVGLRVGKHNVYWGESLYSISDGISYSQGPIDSIKAAATPGVEVKELFIPTNQISAQLQLASNFAVFGQYMLDWKPFRLVPGGTFLAGSDAVRSDFGSTTAEGFAIPNGQDITPKKRGNFGVGARWTPGFVEGTLGAFYRVFDERAPWAAMRLAPSGLPAPFPPVLPAEIQLNYARDTKLVGLSYTRNLGIVSFGSEVSYRRDSALRSSTVAAVVPTGAMSYEQAEGPRGNTVHALVNGLFTLNSSPVYDGGSVSAELTYTRLQKVTHNPANIMAGGTLFMGDGNTACPAGNRPSTCATKNAWNLQVQFAPQWNQALPGWDLSLPVKVGYGIKGTGATVLGTQEDTASFSIGLNTKFRNAYDFNVAYIDGRADNSVQNDHGRVVFTFKTSF
jgi:hypothetical protein